eukprot:scaffold9242_cov74-Phaeocystis_antarctica.AAC.2
MPAAGRIHVQKPFCVLGVRSIAQRNSVAISSALGCSAVTRASISRPLSRRGGRAAGGARVAPNCQPGSSTSTQIAHVNTITNQINHGPYQADRTQVHRRQGAPQAARHQGGAQVRPGHGRRQEAPPLPPRYRRSPRDPP